MLVSSARCQGVEARWPRVRSDAPTAVHQIRLLHRNPACHAATQALRRTFPIKGICVSELREPYPLPWMELNPDVGSILDFTYEDFRLVGYEHHPVIRAQIAV